MKSRIALVMVAAFAAAGCEHPAASGGLRGPSPAPVAPSRSAAAADAQVPQQALRASTVMRALLQQHPAALAGAPDASAISADAPAVPHVTEAWLQQNAATLSALVARAQTARLALDAAAQQE